MVMMDKIEQYFLNRYRNSDYIIKVKTRMWFYLMALLGFSSFILYICLIIFDLIPMMVWHITIPIMILVPLASIILLKKGKNFIAADLVTLALTIVAILGIYLRYRGNPAEVYMTTFYLVPIVIIGASVFSKIYWVYIYMAVFSIINIIFFTSSLAYHHEQISKAFIQGFVFSCFNLTSIFSLSIFIRVTTNRALKSVQDELGRNIDLNRDLGEKHNMFLDIAGKLERHFNDLKKSSADFQDSSQNTAASIEEISSATEEVMSGVEQVFDVINDQHKGLMMMLEKMKELSIINISISEQIQKVSQSTEDITSMAQQGNEILKQMHSGMSRVSESTRVMENIVTMINDIADKINLLSLNASIEAARAGTSGRGFAVVADEISRLGTMTQSSMTEINKLIQSSGNDVNAGLISVDATVHSMSKIIDTINGIIIEIKDISKKTRIQQDINSMVNTASDSLKIKSDQIKDMMSMQQDALNEIAKSIAGINEITQSYAEGSRKLHLDAEKVEILAEMLKRDENIHEADINQSVKQ
jgi:methyl-accepting chemotaxis protein